MDAERYPFEETHCASCHNMLDIEDEIIAVSAKGHMLQVDIDCSSCDSPLRMMIIWSPQLVLEVYVAVVLRDTD